MPSLTYDAIYTVCEWILRYPADSPTATPTYNLPSPPSICTLLSFSRTSRLFHEASIPVLYSDVSLRDHSQPEALLRTLIEVPHLRRYVRRLRVGMKSYSYGKEHRLAWEKGANLIDLLTNRDLDGSLNALEVSCMPTYCSRDILDVLRKLSMRDNPLRKLHLSSPHPADEAGFFFRWTWDIIEPILFVKFPNSTNKLQPQLGEVLDTLALEGTTLSQYGKWQSKEWVIRPNDSAHHGPTCATLTKSPDRMCNLRTIKLSQCVLPYSLLTHLLLNSPSLLSLTISRPSRLTQGGLFKALMSIPSRPGGQITSLSLSISDAAGWTDGFSSLTSSNLIVDCVPNLKFLHLSGTCVLWPSFIQDIFASLTLRMVEVEGFQKDLEPGKMVEDLRECSPVSKGNLERISLKPNARGRLKDVNWGEAQVARIARAWRAFGVKLEYSD
ncbi:hypothetical protein BT69DRAFT_1351931 [Atractiella rhizophila]|nr:hypothetical protein BT69DRAFT_1351931 [Atractiella rhizophila]